MQDNQYTIILIKDSTATRPWRNTGLSITNARNSAQPRRPGSRSAENSSDLALLDIHIAGANGTDLLKEISKSSEDNNWLIATVSDGQQLLDALSFTRKAVTRRFKINNRRANYPRRSTKPWRSATIPTQKLDRSGSPCDHNLTPRELDVLTLITHGRRLKEAAEELRISVHTVGDHVKSIYKKLKVNNRAEATLQATRLGLIPPLR